MATPLVDKLFVLLDDDNIDWDAAHALGKLATGDDVLTKRNGAVLKVRISPQTTLLTKILSQRFYMHKSISILCSRRSWSQREM